MNKIIVTGLILSSLLFVSCSQVKTTDSFTAMNTFMAVSVYSSSGKKGRAVCDELQSKVCELEGVLSTTLSTSDVYKLNHNKSLNAPVNPELSELLDFSGKMFGLSGGAFNPALYPVIREWGFTTEEYKVPSSERVQELLLNTDFSEVECDISGVKLKEGMELDFGAVGKGYAADNAVAILKKNGIKSALLDFGGNIQTVGKKPDGSLWRVGIKNPWEGGAAAALSVESKAVVTSGGYERYFEKDGVRYIHIFDPETGCPSLSDLESVTIVCESGKYADALSTALFVMGKDDAVSFYNATGDFDFILITKNHSLIYSARLEGFIELLTDFSSVECIADSFEN